MIVETFLDTLASHGIDFFAGVPDSLLRPLCDSLTARYGIDPEHHLIPQNEGGCVALGAGYHMASGKVPCIYMQNSGIGNAVNPVASLTNPAVYAIPQLFVVGWRGEPGTKDEPQHVFQGEATLRMLEAMDVETVVLGKETGEAELEAAMQRFDALFAEGKSAAFVVRKGALTSATTCCYRNSYSMKREDAVRMVAHAAGEGVIVSTTGKISRELFEIREADGFGHGHDFLTVGSMGHSSLVALGIALQKKDTPVWVIDGDGAVLMHTGAMAVVGSQSPQHFIHVVLNNLAHETVGGMSTVAGAVDFPELAQAFGYKAAFVAHDAPSLGMILEIAKTASAQGPVLIEIQVELGSREDLGRPTTTARENKESFMQFLQGEQ